MTNAPIEPHHKDMAAKAAGYVDWRNAECHGNSRAENSILAHAQTLANLEKARADLAEIFDALRYAEGDDPKISAALAIAAPYPASDPRYGSVHTDGSRSGGQPVTSCPDCEAFRREVSVACSVVVKGAGEYYAGDGNTIETHLSRFIIPASDPVAEALKGILTAFNVDAVDENDQRFPAALAKFRAFIEGDRSWNR